MHITIWDDRNGWHGMLAHRTSDSSYVTKHRDSASCTSVLRWVETQIQIANSFALDVVQDKDNE